MSKSECCVRRLCEAMGKDAVADILVDALAGIWQVTAADFILAAVDFYEALEMAEAYNNCMWHSAICNNGEYL